jgi:hypothetical protein
MRKPLQLDHPICEPFCLRVLLQISLFMSFEGRDCNRFVILHQVAVSGHIGVENGGRFTLDFVLCDDPPPGAEGLENPG